MVHWLWQLVDALSNALFDNGTLPFFSLHFNADGSMYPVMHPAWQGNIVGHVIGLLDYRMKGYLNGGCYSSQFLEGWQHEYDRNKEEALSSEYLRQHVIDLEQLLGEKYISLRELLANEGLVRVEGDAEASNDDGPHSIRGQEIQSSFRIFASPGAIERMGPLFVAEPEIKVEYTIEPSAAYQTYLATYKSQVRHRPAASSIATITDTNTTTNTTNDNTTRTLSHTHTSHCRLRLYFCWRRLRTPLLLYWQHGTLPSDYLKLDEIYQRYTRQMEQHLPLVDAELCTMVGLISYLACHITTMKKAGRVVSAPPSPPINVQHNMGRNTRVEDAGTDAIKPFPKVLPPFPIKRIVNINFKIRFARVLADADHTSPQLCDQLDEQVDNSVFS